MYDNILGISGRQLRCMAMELGVRMIFLLMPIPPFPQSPYFYMIILYMRLKRRSFGYENVEQMWITNLTAAEFGIKNFTERKREMMHAV